MGNRCPDCNKFVSLEAQEPEVDVDVDGDLVTGTVRLILSCMECGTEMKEANLDIEIEIDHECDTPGDFEVEDTQAEATDRYQTKDRHGKPIKKTRYQKHYYGADVTVTVKCGGCDETITLTNTVEEQASGFDDLN